LKSKNPAAQLEKHCAGDLFDFAFNEKGAKLVARYVIGYTIF
jgi:hypothetical protein